MDTKNGHTYKNGVTFYKPFFLVSMLVFGGYTVYYNKKTKGILQGTNISHLEGQDKTIDSTMTWKGLTAVSFREGIFGGGGLHDHMTTHFGGFAVSLPIIGCEEAHGILVNESNQDMMIIGLKKYKKLTSDCHPNKKTNWLMIIVSITVTTIGNLITSIINNHKPCVPELYFL